MPRKGRYGAGNSPAHPGFINEIQWPAGRDSDTDGSNDEMMTETHNRPVFDARRGGLPCLLLAGLLLLPLPGTLHALGTPAGTAINNQARLDFLVGGNPGQAFSNGNAFTVQELINVTSVWQDAASVGTTAAASSQVLTFLVRNTGNGIETFALSINNGLTGSDDYDPQNARIHIDGNGNNVYDGPALDPLYVAGSNDPQLDANGADSVVLFVLNDTPGGVGNGDTGDSQLTAASITAGAAGAAAGSVLAGLGDGGADAVVGSSNASTAVIGTYTVSASAVDVSLAKSATVLVDGLLCSKAPCDAVPGATIRYTLQVDVTGGGTADNLVITDSIPGNTTYVPASITLDSSAQTDAGGDDAGTFSPGLVSVDLGDVTGPDSFTITLDVTVN